MMRRLLSAVALVMVTWLAMPLSASAFSVFNSACNAPGTNKSVACSTSNGDPIGGTQGLLVNVTHIVAYIAGAIAVIMIIVGAIRFITSGSDLSTGSRTDTDVEDAKRTISSALIGLAVIVLAQAIITYVIRRF